MASRVRRVTLRSAATAAFVLVCVAWPEPATIGEARAVAFDGTDPQAAAPRVITASDLWLVPRPDVFQARASLARAVTMRWP